MTDANTRLDDFLTTAEIQAAIKLYAEASPGTFARRCEAEIIRPVIGRINAALKQENDPRFLAYAVEYVLDRCGK